MTKENLIILMLILGLSVNFRMPVFAEEGLPAELKFEVEMERTKGDREKTEKIYYDFIQRFFNEIKLETSLKLIEEFGTKYPDSKYMDDIEWFNLNVKRYILHNYNELKDGYSNLIEKYGAIKLDKDKTEISKKELENELAELNELLKKREELEDSLKGIDAGKEFEKYFEIGKLYREFADFKQAEEWYLKGTKVDPENEKTAELFYEMGDMYRFVGLKAIPIGTERTSIIQRYYGANECYKKALTYYLEVYKRYPKNKLAPKALENAGDLYTQIVWELRKPTEEELEMQRLGMPENVGTLIPIFYLDKSAEMYEKIWREYPEWEGRKEMPGKIYGIYAQLMRSEESLNIEYCKKLVEIAKDLPIDVKGVKIFLERAEKYKELYGEYPKITRTRWISGGYLGNIDMAIKQTEELIEKKQKEQEGGNK
ncbi:MAG: hypothetical protein AB1498_01370 [bacterium]